MTQAKPSLARTRAYGLTLYFHSFALFMTESARAGYPLASQTSEPLPHHMAFNDLQHQLFIYLRHTRDDSAVQDFLEGQNQKTKASKLRAIWVGP